MTLTGVVKQAGAAFAPPRRRLRARVVADNPPPMTIGQAIKSREFAGQMHRAIAAKGYTEADITRIIKEVRAERRGAKS